MVWIDHVKTSQIGRQHYVAGNGATGRVTISNSEIDGQTDFSATCDGHHYWNMLFIGANDQYTLKGNYIHGTSGRGPKVGGNTVLHLVNNVWADVNGHALETDSGSKVLIEGNVFDGVKAPMQDGGSGKVLAINDSKASGQCSNVLQRECAANLLGSSGALNGADTSVLTGIKAAATAASAEEAKGSVMRSAGFGKI
jgi:pectin lyase